MCLKPQHLAYLFAHVVLFFAGMLIIYARDDAVSQGIGSSLIATAVTGWVVFVYISTGQSLRARLEVIQQLGIVAGFVRRGAAIREEYSQRISRSSRHIDIFGFGLRSLREDFRHEFVTWKARAHVRILLLDPQFPSPMNSYANQRDAEEHANAGTTANEIALFLQETQLLVDDRFQVRLYRCLPAVNIFRIDDELFWGPYLMKEASRNAPTFIVRSGAHLYEAFTKHFDEIWKNHSVEAHD